jgi:hypothetical protein
VDGSRLVQRDDDRPEVIQHRLAQYREKTAPVIGYYERQSILRRVDGSRSPDEVSDQIAQRSPRSGSVVRFDRPQEAEVEAMAAAGDIGGLSHAARDVQAGVSTEDLGGDKFIRARGGGPCSWLPRLPEVDLHLAELHGCTASRAVEPSAGDVISIDVGPSTGCGRRRVDRCLRPEPGGDPPPEGDA